MFFFWLIVAIVLTIAAIADIILTNLSDILSVLASLIFFGWTFFQTGYENISCFQQRGTCMVSACCKILIFWLLLYLFSIRMWNDYIWER